MNDWRIETAGPVTVVTMTTGENKISRETLDAWNQALDTLDARTGPHALVITGEDKYWSTGLDLTAVAEMSLTDRDRFLADLDLLLERLLTAGYVTIAALNGHAYAAGALLALACDYRVMRIDRGFFCLPSVDIGIPFSPGMTALITAKIPQPAAHDLIVSCRAIGAREALVAGAIHRAVDADNVMPAATEIAHAYADKDPETLKTVKQRMYGAAVAALTGSR
ncbi:MAG: enoyl-CoA hydratase/isomerase family protein [Actinomycetota bacterium]